MRRMRPTTTSRRRLAAFATTATLALLGGLATASPASADKPQGGHCARQSKIRVPGAQVQEVACLDDLTTAGTVASGHTNPNDWAGLNAAGTVTPTGVPGIQVDGYFPDTSTAYPDRLRPLLPCARSAFDALTAWVERGTAPPADGFVARP